MKKKGIVLILMTLLLGAASIAVIFAWLIDIKETPSITLKSGKVEYQFSGSAASGLIVPGQNLVNTQYQIVNNSTVKSQLRIQLTIKLDGTAIVYGTGTEADDDRVDVTLGLGSDFTKESDGFYYYGGLTGVLLETNTTPIVIVSSIILDGYEVRNEYSGKIVQIIIKIQAKQADHVTWQTLTEEAINFQTGT
ncbi:MAG TPA: hypothetical protein PLP51_01595 [Acholeplasmataceae bacterium]|jgi:hypothetical protein|nr:hypothetical protein [Acholeplasmataceae bacterium]HQC30411.1 hypothetical protein [Acholeplasmataceae bacterium]